MIMKRLGFHYFPDTQHYRQHDIKIWLPQLESIGTRWLVLRAPSNRTIPEHFIRTLIDANIQPILHFILPIKHFPAFDDLKLLFNVYQRWGVRYVTLFDQPNIQKYWPTSNWTQVDLVERFIDIYLPLANASLNSVDIAFLPRCKVTSPSRFVATSI